MHKIAVKECYHLGICVQNLDWTLNFFQDVLGAEVLDISPRDPKNQSFVTGVDNIEVTIGYVQCHGQLIEFMEYRGEIALEHHKPRMVDVGHFHLCFRVENLQDAVAVCKSYDDRITTLSPEPLIVDSGPNKGNGVILVVLPDGMMIEFSGKT
jgi:catechol 2,3-dioxygenase-like lactoylglutathione lyase family enzyme